MSSEATEVW